MDFFNDLIHKTLKMEIGMRQPTSSFKYIWKKYLHFMYVYIKAFFFEIHSKQDSTQGSFINNCKNCKM